jgi:transposase
MDDYRTTLAKQAARGLPPGSERIFYILRTGSPSRDLPERYGPGHFNSSTTRSSALISTPWTEKRGRRITPSVVLVEDGVPRSMRWSTMMVCQSGSS